MGNTAVNKILPAVDLLLVLVVAMFSTAGFVRSLEGSTGAHADEYERIQKELAEKEEKARQLEDKQKMLKEYGDNSIDFLNALLGRVKQKQQNISIAEERVEKIRTQFDEITAKFQDTFMARSIKNRIEVLKQTLEQLEKERDLLQNQVSQADREKVHANELQQKLEAIDKEIEKLKALIKEFEKKIPRTRPVDRPGLFPRYKGPYILLECDTDGATIYPGKIHIANIELDSKTEWLKNEIKKKGAAALVARPGSFEESYASFYGLLTELAGYEEAQGNTLIIGFWPIEENESIDKYLP